MSRVAKNPVPLPKGVEVTLNGRDVTVKGGRGSLAFQLSEGIDITQEESVLRVAYANEKCRALAGTTRALVNNMVIGVSDGWERRLLLNGVGYRAKSDGKSVNLTVGLSHPVDYTLPEGVSAETPTQTEVVLRGIDKQAVGQAAAVLRSFRPPEPYKGKGIRYSDEIVRRKEAKKK
ncbi:50S ribosomal protein L6 [Kineobactrum sediminis]|uniref:Large ribosomal subunit protein uL6 n=1 Tax=Kineobactrum sediminis TaxID=1905677 RepID=A0A2N5XY95_9GAMM|nr:50S ribosomal protein L6 [Kineobactrum sediminis]PLW81124.1 50S ribosomal protein L6 [Kineobactrum sediminis]